MRESRGFQERGAILHKFAVGGLVDRLRSWFPDREFFMRSDGQVRFIKISARVQMIAAGVIAALALAWIASATAMAVSSYLSARDRLSLLDREAKVTTAESRVSAYRGDLGKVTTDLQKRQAFIEQLVESHLGELPRDARAGETVSDSASEAGKTVDKVSLALPEAAGLARIEARQLHLVESLTRLADRRSAAAAAKLARLGLNPRAMLAALDSRNAQGRDAQGGPLLVLATAADGSVDPRFQRLGLSLARMDALERSLAKLPQVLPASLEYISSGFGYRADPFTGAGAFHPGLDFRGPTGAPIYAAAPGRVTFVGPRAGYGNCVEIDHGNGLLTRYAHMSRFRTHVGRQVGSGEVVGLIGSTGRSTGPHLHFEVRINDRPVNPRPFLEAAPNVFQKITPTSLQRTR
jgi:murein DD-endopeptidase MepM/ murein hydrolase activator NlpD